MLKGVDRIRSSRLTRLPNASKLAQLGVCRLSAGSVIPQVIWQHVAHLTEAFSQMVIPVCSPRTT